MPVLNIAAYRFASIDAPATWVDPIRARAATLALKGTVIVAHEGVNLFLAGDEAAIEGFVAWLGDDPRFVGADGAPVFRGAPIKRSWSDAQPFRRLRVKYKAEIVTMRRPAVRPDAGRAPSIDPATLARWLARGHDDRGRPVTLLDTRNAFEVAHGTFDGALHLDLTRFDEFPDAADRLSPALRDETVVTFCTGGIRCEKAALYLRNAGFAHALQLDGGILGYFEAVGDAGWRGACFVFDERVALGADLAPADAGSGSVRNGRPSPADPVLPGDDDVSGRTLARSGADSVPFDSAHVPPADDRVDPGTDVGPVEAAVGADPAAAQPAPAFPVPAPASASISSGVKPAARRAATLNGPRSRGAP